MRKHVEAYEHDPEAADNNACPSPRSEGERGESSSENDHSPRPRAQHHPPDDNFLDFGSKYKNSVNTTLVQLLFRCGMADLVPSTMMKLCDHVDRVLEDHPDGQYPDLKKVLQGFQEKVLKPKLFGQAREKAMSMIDEFERNPEFAGEPVGALRVCYSPPLSYIPRRSNDPSC